MKIAVIIPTLNEEQALPGTLASVTRLGFDELIVVDGGSTDKTRDIVTSLVFEVRACAPERFGPRRRGSRFQEQPEGQPPQISPPSTSNVEHRTSPVTLLTSAAGRAKQMNAGASQSQADVLLFLHADTHLPDDARQVVEDALADPACVGGRFDLRFERDTGLAWLIARLISLRSRWSGIATGDQALFVRRDAFAKLGGFADIPIMEDVDFTRRLKHVGRVAPLRARVITSYRRWERCGASRTIALMWALRFLYWMGVAPVRLHRFYTVIR
ncbi:MAG TPA: TIGR04283 family arsenosugar biosynthesis glycosyltransferase [Nitrospiraceae bacterium]